MLKIRLKKEQEGLYGINIGLAVFTLISLGILIYQYHHGNNTTMGGIRLFLVVHIVLQLVVSLLWLPYAIKRKTALKKGREVECQITDIKFKKRNFKSAMRSLQFNYKYQNVYYIKVKYELDGEKKLSILDDYGDDPSDYLPYDYRQRKYKLYIYEKELFLQDLYLLPESERNILKNESFLKKLQAQPISPEHEKELEESIKKHNEILSRILADEYNDKSMEELIKYPIEKINSLGYKEFDDAIEERELYSFISSSEFIIPPPIYFKTSTDKYEAVIEIQMISKKAYTYAGFTFSTTVREYLQMIESTYNDSMEKEVIHHIYKMVRKNILEEDINIIIKKINIAICKYPEREN